MKSLQLKMTVWIASVFFGLMFFILLLFNFFMFRAVYQQETRVLKNISRGILAELKAAKVRTRPIPPTVIARIQDKINFINRKRRMQFAILGADRKIWYRTPHFSGTLDERMFARRHRHLFLVGVGSGQEVGDFFSNWRFLFYYPGKQFYVLIQAHRDFELAEKFANGFGIVLLVVLAFSLPCGYFLSRRMLRPIEAIDQTVHEIRRGNLAARIPPYSSRDEMARLIETLNQTFAELEDSFSRIRQFSADAAHELNTPLTAIRGTLDVCLGKERTAEEYREVLADTANELQALSRLTHDLLLLAQPGDAAQRLHFAPLDLAVTVDECVARLEILAREKNLKFQVQPCEDCPRVRGDAILVERLTYNLLHNAVRFSPEQGTVTVLLEPDGDALRLDVQDQGIGIARADQQRIFDRFYQVEESRSAGSGLGLALVQWAVRLHHGQIEVESEVGKGSTFRVWLPIEADQNKSSSP